jgi:hypothetical protein
MHRISPRPWVNGSSSYDLIDQTMTVHRALEDAAHAMRLWQPHGRDYQIGGDYQADHAEYLRRLKLVEELAAQYENEAYSISKQEV